MCSTLRGRSTSTSIFLSPALPASRYVQHLSVTKKTLASSYLSYYCWMKSCTYGVRFYSENRKERCLPATFWQPLTAQIVTTVQIINQRMSLYPLFEIAQRYIFSILY
jgi:hypothetical protein